MVPNSVSYCRAKPFKVSAVSRYGHLCRRIFFSFFFWTRTLRGRRSCKPNLVTAPPKPVPVSAQYMIDPTMWHSDSGVGGSKPGETEQKMMSKSLYTVTSAVTSAEGQGFWQSLHSSNTRGHFQYAVRNTRSNWPLGGHRPGSGDAGWVSGRAGDYILQGLTAWVFRHRGLSGAGQGRPETGGDMAKVC